MTKLDLQKELLEKVKPGMKPSDLKKPREQNNQIFTPPPLSNNTPASTPPPSPIIGPVDKKSKQKQAKKPVLSSPISIEKAKQLHEQANYWSTTANTYLTNLQKLTAENDNLKLDLTELKNKPAQLTLEQAEALKEANEKIRDLQGKNEKLNKTLARQEKPSKITEETNTFTCSSCTRDFNIELIRLAKKSGKKTCRSCTLLMLKRANQLTGQRIVLKIKNSETNQQTKTFPCQTCQQPSPEEPHQVHVTNFQEQGIGPRQLASICSTCLNEKVILADFYCPRTSEGRDTYNPKEPQFDCDCPRGGKHG